MVVHRVRSSVSVESCRIALVRIAALLILAAGVNTAPASAREGDGRPNVLLIVSEDNGPELGCYGDSFARTPQLDALARQGIRFQRAFVPYSVCSPSRACFLTGLHPHQNGQIGLATHKFAMYNPPPPNVVTLLQPAGYHVGIIGKLHVNPASAFPYDFQAIPSANFQRKIGVEQYVQSARQFWGQAGSKPWFLSVNFPDAHLPFLRQAGGKPKNIQTATDVDVLPWVGARSERLREVTADYYNCLARLDEWVGELLAALDESGQAERTMVIYIGDHGGQFPRGKGSVYEGGLRVPFIVRWPGHIADGQVRDELVSTLDILPSVLSAAQVNHPDGLAGRALQPLFDGHPAPSWRTYVHAMTTGSFPRNCFIQHSIRDQRYKLIVTAQPGTRNLIAASYLDESHPHYVVSGIRQSERQAVSARTEAALRRWEHPPQFELYDLQSDPYEWHNLAGDPHHAATLDRLSQALTKFRHATRDPFLDEDNVRRFVDEQLDHRDLRYRRDATFRWSYLDTFPAWRARQ